MWLLFLVTTCFALSAHGFTQQGNDANADKLNFLSKIHSHLYSSFKPSNSEEMQSGNRRKRNVKDTWNTKTSVLRNRRQAVYEDPRTTIMEHVRKMQHDMMLQNLEYESVNKRHPGKNERIHENNTKDNAKDKGKRLLMRKRHKGGIKLFESKNRIDGHHNKKELRGILKKPGSVSKQTLKTKRVRMSHDSVDKGSNKHLQENLDKREKRETKEKEKKKKKPRVFLVVKKIPFMKNGHVEYKYVVLKKLYVGSALANKIRNNKRFVKKEKAKHIGILWKPPSKSQKQAIQKNAQHIVRKNGHENKGGESLNSQSTNRTAHERNIQNEAQNNRKRSYIPRPVIKEVSAATKTPSKMLHGQKVLPKVQVQKATHANKETVRLRKVLLHSKKSNLALKQKITLEPSVKMSHMNEKHSVKGQVSKSKSTVFNNRKNSTLTERGTTKVINVPTTMHTEDHHKLIENTSESKGIKSHILTKGMLHNTSSGRKETSTTKLLEEVKNNLTKETQVKLSASVRQLSRCSNARKKLVDLFQMVDLSLKRAATLSKIIGEKFGIDPKMIEEMTASSEKKAVEQFLDTLAEDSV